MRFPAALFFCFSALLVWSSCDDDDSPLVEPSFTIDCESINTFDTTLCSVLNTDDSTAYVNAFLGSWYLKASQNSGFGGGSTACVNYLEAESPYRFVFNSDYTWQLIDTENNIDTTLSWTVTLGFGGWRLVSTRAGISTPELSHLCDNNLVTDLRPLDGPLRVYARAN